MKKLLLLAFLALLLHNGDAQVLYFKGEWTALNKAELFTGIFKVQIKKDSRVKGELLWTFLATDNTNSDLRDHYKGKKGKRGIEFVEGIFTRETNDIFWEGKTKYDPADILGLDKYYLKLSADKKVLYGKTDYNGTGNGMFYALRVSAATARQTLAAAKRSLKK